MTTSKDLILLVDDDTTILSTSQMMLEALGYEVEAAESGEKAVEIATGNCDRFKLILTDLSMPDMDGQVLLTKMRELGFKGPIAIVSGYALNVDDLDGDFVGVLMKPFRLNTLKEKVAEFLGN